MVFITKNKKCIGTCALCKANGIELRESHLIPKLVYMRTKSTKKARFRAVNNIKKPLQDGEKKFMLCDECEKFFNVFETQFANHFLDDFLKTQKLNKFILQLQWMLDYTLSVMWRILYDELYNTNSFVGDSIRADFINGEKIIRDYLNALKNKAPAVCPNYKYYVYKIDEIVKDDRIVKLLEPTLFGYCYFDATYQIPIVFTYYLGLVFIIAFDNDEVLYIDSIKKMLYRKYFMRKIVKGIIASEMKHEALYAVEMYEKNMTPDLREKIKEYYSH